VKISIITVCLNSERTIADAINSVASQSYENYEHLVIDGGSCDQTLKIIDSIKSEKVKLITEADNGIYDAMNKGINLAAGDVVGFLNADDILASSTVFLEVANALRAVDVDAVYSNLIYVDKKSAKVPVRFWKSSKFTENLFAQGWMPPHPTFYCKKQIYKKFGVFNLRYKKQADFELLARLMEKYKIRTNYIDSTWVKMRTGGVSNNSIIRVLIANLESYVACKENGLKINIFFIPRKVLSRIPQYLAAIKIRLLINSSHE
jgi:glycosyltransferase involved in cell wall biosynthesis